MNGFDCDMIKNRTGRTFGGAPSKSANTCADILGAGSSEYTAFVNVPGVNDLSIAVSYTHLTLPTNREV